MNTNSISLDEVLNNTVDGVLVMDRSRRVVLFNRGCERITGQSRSEVVGFECRCYDALSCHDEQGRSLAGALCPARGLFETNSADSACQRMCIRRPDGTSVWIETKYTVARDDEGNVDLIIGVMRDISHAKEAQDILVGELSDLRARVQRLIAKQKAEYGFTTIVSKSASMTPVLERVRAALSNSSAVLISGESGTGKEVVARTIHAHGLQNEGPFVPLNCSALPKELIESELFGHARGAFTGAVQDHHGLLRTAEGGTIFLDEIGQMPIETQSKLLRVLQDKRVRPVGATAEMPVRVRVIAAMNEPPRGAIAEGRLREDLYYRLNVIGIGLPSLRDRREDIPLLVDSFMKGLNQTALRQVNDVSPDAWSALLDYAWPGNIRELSNAVESAFALGQGPVLARADLPPDVRGVPQPAESRYAGESLLLDPFLNQVEREAICRALRAADGGRKRAAKIMGISRSRLYRRMEALRINPAEIMTWRDAPGATPACASE